MTKLKYVRAHLATAANYAKLSHCERLKVGAAIVAQRSESIFVGYNGRPRGEPNVGEVDGVTHPDVQHAEVNALKKLMRSNESSVGSELFCTDSPCRACAIDLVDAGVSTVYYSKVYRDVSGVLYLLNHGVKVFRYDQARDLLYEVKRAGEDRLEYVYDPERK